MQDNTSPFGKKLTRIQCIQYALDKPGVLTVLPGIRGKNDLIDILKYTTATPEEKDYSIIGNFTPVDAEGKCVYCNHCEPCPAGLDIGLINKTILLMSVKWYKAVQDPIESKLITN